MAIARKPGAPIYLMGLAISPAITLDTWDRITFAWPFGRGATAWDGPYYVPADADDAALGALTEELSAKLTATRARAEALVARR